MKMSPRKSTLLIIALVLCALSFASSLFAGALSVSMTPSSDQIVLKNENINFNCSPSGGCTPYTYSWSASNATLGTPTSQSSVATFGADAEGKENTVTITVTDNGGNTASANVKVTVPKVDLCLEQSVVTLLKMNKLTATVTPSGLTVLNYKFEIKRTSASTWTQLASASSDTFIQLATVAGHFKVRVTATVQGTTIVSSEEDGEVQFPDISEILSDGGVQARMNQTWSDTKNATTSTTRREEGYYITLDTSSGVYGIIAHTIGTPVQNNQGAG